MVRQFAAAWFVSCAVIAGSASACPFCTAVAPSLAQLREQADIVLLAEVLETGKPPLLRVHRTVKGKSPVSGDSPLRATVDADLLQGTLALLFGSANGDAIRWHAVPANETVAGYFFASPSLRTPERERLPYFAGYLEHPEDAIAADAYNELGRAPFDVVSQLGDAAPSEKLRAWIVGPAVPPARKGLYGLLLGLAKDEAARRENARLLQKQIEAGASDFRAGFDGMIGGYLLLAGAPGLKLIESRLLSNPKAAVGDVRHAMTALRFYHEYGNQISSERLSSALALVLKRPEFAEAAITDLARWQAWKYCDEIAGLYHRRGFDSSELRRAIVGYLRTCPSACCGTALADLRQSDPTGVANAESILEKLGRLPR
jgi:hypothetical protein